MGQMTGKVIILNWAVEQDNDFSGDFMRLSRIFATPTIIFYVTE